MKFLWCIMLVDYPYGFPNATVPTRNWMDDVLCIDVGIEGTLDDTWLWMYM